ncbi:Hypothetical predicted protein [Mytilus galloprovincialis]|uniref:B box-type domain-containing protein n=1 Tax=Mytilus galloprovincialis TaxID=29158 RepID=A0A8B6D1K7_MYTGA|nr:Hypothetical predicted protein [Mytilus galloprovincialis]
MAHSGLFRKGQIQITCQLCEIPNRKISWKCEDCDLLMCGNCRENIHSKVKTSEDHHIINIKDIGKEENKANEKIKISNIKCNTHQHQTCCLFCKDCSKVVCSICITDVHNGHKLQNINEAYELKIKYLNDRQERTKRMLEELELRENDLAEIESDRRLKHNETKQAILAEKETIIKTINRRAEKFFEKLDTELETIIVSVDCEKSQLVRAKVSLKEKLKITTNALKLKNFVHILENELKSDTQPLPIRTENNYCNSISYFVPASIKEVHLGTLQTYINAHPKTFNVILKVKKNIRTKLPCIHAIATGNDEATWITDSRNGKLQMVIPGNEEVLVIVDINIVVFSMAIVPSGDLLVATGDSVLKIINSKTVKLTKSIYSAFDQIITAVHLTEENNLILGARSKEIRFAPTGRKVLIVMNLDGEIQTIWEFDRGNKPLFTYPRYITSNKKGNIGIVDWFSDEGNGRVVILSPNGNILNVYDGQPDMKTRQLGGIVSTKADNFIVTDPRTNTLHILNSNGKCVYRFNTLSIGIQSPYYLAFQKSGKLYIGTLNLKQQNLFELTYSGC